MYTLLEYPVIQAPYGAGGLCPIRYTLLEYTGNVDFFQGTFRFILIFSKQLFPKIFNFISYILHL